ncbi:putative holin [Stenotrophomonas sp. MMGLT7]|uniref:putative holin n=1 Tax=Stenotrophomonas sp. MMGLT7 TaxID=2901227 RepID=UPI001E2DFED9|nr:phage holin family protein [Stenotrophomonas sp. MMGLT7]
MTEPTSTSIIIPLATGVGLAALLPGIDGNALVGAFAGGTLFVVSAKTLPLWQRFVYLAISIVAGYYGAGELIQRGFFRSTGVVGFIVSSVAVTVMLAAIEQCKQVDFKGLLKSIFNRGGSP